MNYINMLANTSPVCTEVVSGGIPAGVAGAVHLVVLGIQVVVPILLIIFGMLDFAKAIIGQDEKEIKAKQQVFIKRLIAAVVVFLIVTIVNLVINVVGSLGDENQQSGTAWTCAKELMNGHK